jgi:hypothetical protein
MTLLERQRLAGCTRHEAVTSSWNVHDIAFTSLAVTQGAPQLNDVEAQAALLDRYIGPNSRDELALSDHLARSSDEKTEQIESPAAHGNRRAVTFQETSVRNDTERPERKDLHQSFRIVVAASVESPLNHVVPASIRQELLLASAIHRESSWFGRGNLVPYASARTSSCKRLWT